MNSQLQQYRELLNAILDQLIPANPEKRIPAAGEFGVGKFIQAQAAADESVSTALNQLLENAAKLNGSVDAELVAKIESDDTANFNVLLSLTYKGYYSQPEIRSLVGLESWPVHPKGYEVPFESSDLIGKLTAPVIERGPMYRRSSDEKQVSS